MKTSADRTLQRVTSLLKSPGMWCIFVKVSVSGPYWLREQEALGGERMSLEMRVRKLSTNLFFLSSGDKAKLYEPMSQHK